MDKNEAEKKEILATMDSLRKEDSRINALIEELAKTNVISAEAARRIIDID